MRAASFFLRWLPGMDSWIPPALALALALALPRAIVPPSATLDPAPSLVATLAHVLADEIPTHLVETRAAFSQARGRKRFLPAPFPTSNYCPFSQLMIPSCPCPLVATLAPALLAATLGRALFDLLVDLGTYLLTH